MQHATTTAISQSEPSKTLAQLIRTILRACLHEGRVPRLGGLKHSPPLQAIHLSKIVSVISFERSLSTMNKMAEKNKRFGEKLDYFSSHVPLAAAFQCLGLLFYTLLFECSHLRQLTFTGK